MRSNRFHYKIIAHNLDKGIDNLVVYNSGDHRINAFSSMELARKAGHKKLKTSKYNYIGIEIKPYRV